MTMFWTVCSAGWRGRTTGSLWYSPGFSPTSEFYSHKEKTCTQTGLCPSAKHTLNLSCRCSRGRGHWRVAIWGHFWSGAFPSVPPLMLLCWCFTWLFPCKLSLFFISFFFLSGLRGHSSPSDFAASWGLLAFWKPDLCVSGCSIGTRPLFSSNWGQLDDNLKGLQRGEKMIQGLDVGWRKMKGMGFAVSWLDDI